MRNRLGLHVCGMVMFHSILCYGVLSDLSYLREPATGYWIFPPSLRNQSHVQHQEEQRREQEVCMWKVEERMCLQLARIVRTSSEQRFVLSSLSRDVARGQLKRKLTSIIDLPTARIHRLQQLVHFIITHLLPQIRQDCIH